MRVINGIECIGSSPKGRGCSTKDFDVKISHQKDGRVTMRIKKPEIILNGKTVLLGFLNGKMYFIPADSEDAITIYCYDNKWYLRSNNPELVERLKDVNGCYTAYYDRKVKAWYIVLNNKED